MSANAALELIYRRNLQQRLQFFRAIFEELKGREFGVQDVSKVIGMTHSGTRRPEPVIPVRQPVVAFRHWMDAALFGPARSVEGMA